MTIKFFIIFAIIFFYKLLTNIINLVQVSHYKELFYDFISNQNNNLPQHKSQVIQLFKNAGIKDANFSVTKPAGYGYISHGKASVFDNFPSLVEDFVLSTGRMFEEAIGTYKSRIFECFNSIYWINCIIFLPKAVLAYLGVSAESIFIKIFQILYWAISIIFALFSSEIAVWIKSFLQIA